jgi:hypothetical protein
MMDVNFHLRKEGWCPLQVPPATRWRRQAVMSCDVRQVTDSYHAALLMAAIMMQEWSGNPRAIGKAHHDGCQS